MIITDYGKASLFNFIFSGAAQTPPAEVWLGFGYYGPTPLEFTEIDEDGFERIETTGDWRIAGNIAYLVTPRKMIPASSYRAVQGAPNRVAAFDAPVDGNLLGHEFINPANWGEGQVIYLAQHAIRFEIRIL